MKKAISSAEANREFSRLLREVGKGKSFIVTTHGRPVACISPADIEERETVRAKKALLDRLRSQPVKHIGHWTRDEIYED